MVCVVWDEGWVSKVGKKFESGITCPSSNFRASCFCCQKDVGLRLLFHDVLRRSTCALHEAFVLLRRVKSLGLTFGSPEAFCSRGGNLQSYEAPSFWLGLCCESLNKIRRTPRQSKI